MSELGDIPLIGGIAETAIHAGTAVGDAVTGDWDGAAHEAYGMAGSALHTVADDLTGGVATVGERVYDAAAGGLGLPSSDDISSGIEGGLHDLGNALGDGAYNLVHGDDPDPLAGLNTGDLGTGGADTGAGGASSPDQGGADGGYDPSMDGGDMSGGDGSY
jgi:hypothetical protein